MGQQPNIELEISDLPRPVLAPAAPRRWRPHRPGELHSPDDVPWGGAYGMVGPDTGYALSLVAQREFELADGEVRSNGLVAVAAVAGARASHFGRAPMPEDVDIALLILGFAPDGLPANLVDTMSAERRRRLGGVGHDPSRVHSLVAAIPIDVLGATAEEVHRRMAAGERLIDW